MKWKRLKCPFYVSFYLSSPFRLSNWSTRGQDQFHILHENRQTESEKKSVVQEMNEEKKNKITATAKCNKSRTTYRWKTCKRTVCALIKFCPVPIEDVKKPCKLDRIYSCVHIWLSVSFLLSFIFFFLQIFNAYSILAVSVRARFPFGTLKHI